LTNSITGPGRASGPSEGPLTRGGDSTSELPFTPSPNSSPHAYPAAEHWGDEAEGGADWRRYLSAVVRHKWLVIGGLVLGLLAGIMAYRSVEPTFEVASTVWIQTGGNNQQGDVNPIRPSQLLSETGWIDLIQSFAVLDPVVRELRLFVEPAEPGYGPFFMDFQVEDEVEGGTYTLERTSDGATFVLMDGNGRERDRAAPGEPLGAGMGFSWIPPEDTLEPATTLQFRVMRPRDMARNLRESMVVRIDRAGTFLQVSMAGTDPERITRTVNGIVERFEVVAEQLKRAQLDELTAILEEQLAYAEANLRTAELELENFKVQTISLPSEQGAPVAAGIQQTQDPAFQNFFNLRLEQEELQRDRRAIERAMERSREQERLTLEALEIIPTVRESSELMGVIASTAGQRADLRALRLRYTDEHPAVVALRRDLGQVETVTIPGLLTDLLDEVQQREQEIQVFLDRASAELRQIPPRAVEETRLERRYESAENLFRDLQARYESARLGAASTIPDIRALDRAQVPNFPTSDRSMRFFAMALMAGLGLGLGGAILRDMMDPRVRRPDQVTKELGLPILATIPQGKRRNGRLREDDQYAMIEAFRGLRMAVAYAHGGRSPLVTAVSSPSPGDGKSFTTSNLGLAFAEMGESTLVIDGDIRRGTQHTLFDVERKPGLTDFLSGDISYEQAIQDTEHPLLKVIASGSRFSDAPELLGLPAMTELISRARSEFDVILVDTSPLGAAVDPYILGAVAGSLIVLVKEGSTDQNLAQTRIEDLRRLPIHLLGAVLNAVPSSSGYGYYSYSPRYQVQTEGRSDSRRRLIGANTG